VPVSFHNVLTCNAAKGVGDGCSLQSGTEEEKKTFYTFSPFIIMIQPCSYKT